MRELLINIERAVSDISTGNYIPRRKAALERYLCASLKKMFQLRRRTEADCGQEQG